MWKYMPEIFIHEQPSSKCQPTFLQGNIIQESKRSKKYNAAFGVNAFVRSSLSINFLMLGANVSTHIWYLPLILRYVLSQLVLSLCVHVFIQ